MAVNFSFFHTVVCTLWKNEKFTLTKIFFCQINSLMIYLVNALLSRNFCQKRVKVNFRNFHTVVWKLQRFCTNFSQIFREIKLHTMWEDKNVDTLWDTRNGSKNNIMKKKMLLLSEKCLLWTFSVCFHINKKTEKIELILQSRNHFHLIFIKKVWK